ncbi:lactosylceramide alpha-2,3-sialyltransferase-like isoform X2 [Narcine bancroftii]|uniref:lactosylceramide alpha-2,3-sialyltransferase-like isoform X2 n=1 Tax=Narcine bancroftii TaxID=1343680 RepID=UPI0038318F60
MSPPRTSFSKRVWSLLTSLLLLVVCYLFLLCPTYLEQQKIWIHGMSPDYVRLLHNQSQRVISSPCRSNFSRTKLSELYPERSLSHIPVFIGRGTSLLQANRVYEPPFGFKGCEEQLWKVLEMLPRASRGIPKDLVLPGCKRCIVVGNGGVLGGSRLGSYIDQHSIVIRLNNGPVLDYVADVGAKTTLRIAYPEGAHKSPQEYDPDSLFVVATFKCTDLTWNLWQKLWFWQSVPELIPLEPHSYRILNLDLIRETAMNYLGFAEPTNHGWRWMQVIPTLGVTSVITALHLCDEVNLAGFGYDMHHPDRPLHYYEAIRMEAMNVQSVHNVNEEKIFLAALVKGKVVNDLTGGVNW